MSCTDLIVLGIPYQLSETQMKEYFLQFGKLVMVQVYNNKFILYIVIKLKNYITLVDKTRCVWKF